LIVNDNQRPSLLCPVLTIYRFYLPFVKGEESAGTPRSKEKGPNSRMDIHNAFPLPVDLVKPVCASRRDPATKAGLRLISGTEAGTCDFQESRISAAPPMPDLAGFFSRGAAKSELFLALPRTRNRASITFTFGVTRLLHIESDFYCARVRESSEKLRTDHIL